jgi:hypothetical protein
MMDDPYWLAKAQEYTSLFRKFFRELSTEDRLPPEEITSLWIHFMESVCDCEGCREESDCMVHIDVPEDWGDDDSEEA